MTNLDVLSQQLRRDSLKHLAAFDESLNLYGMPKAIEIHGDGMIRAQVQYQAALDLEEVERGGLSLWEFVRALESCAGPAPVPGSRVGSACQAITQEEASLILDQVRTRPGAMAN